MEASVVIIIFKNVGEMKISKIFLCLNTGSIVISYVALEESQIFWFSDF